MQDPVTRGIVRWIWVVGLAWLMPVQAAGQFGATWPRGLEGGIRGVVFSPSGAFGDQVRGRGMGGGGGLAHFFGDRRLTGVTLDLNGFDYGRVSIYRQLAPTIPIQVEIETVSSLTDVMLGGQRLLRDGALAPYMRAAVGLAILDTRTRVGGDDQAAPLASVKDLGATTWAVGAGAGLRVDTFTIDEITFVFDLGATYLRAGAAEYVRKDGLELAPSGAVILDSARSPVTYTRVHLGLVLLRRGS